MAPVTTCTALGMSASSSRRIGVGVGDHVGCVDALLALRFLHLLEGHG